MERIELEEADIIELAREIGIPHILPVVFYELAIYAADTGDHGLSNGGYIALLAGAMKLRRALRTKIGKFLYADSPRTCDDDEG